jgi:hypothetical protein
MMDFSNSSDSKSADGDRKSRCATNNLKTLDDYGIKRKASSACQRIAATPSRASILAGEYHENQIRKDFTASERVTIDKALAEQTPERLGGSAETRESKRENFPFASPASAPATQRLGSPVSATTNL